MHHSLAAPQFAALPASPRQALIVAGRGGVMARTTLALLARLPRQRCGQRGSRPQDAVFRDLLEQPVVETARQQPFDTVASPKNAPPFDVALSYVCDKVAGAPQISGADRQRTHLSEPPLEVRIVRG